MFKINFDNLKIFQTLKKYINLKTSSSTKTSFKIKSITAPSVLLSSYLYIQSKRQYSSNKLYSAEQTFRRLSLDELKDLGEGEMRELKYGTKENESILVVKYGGKLRALSNYCPHFGAPMHTGILVDNVVKCPWHGASFDILTGETDISPSIDNLPTYEVLTDENGIFINLPEQVKHSVAPRMVKRDPTDKRKFVIIGGGPAGLSAAETLRQSGYTGEIIIISKEKYAPYDRTLLSKFFPAGVEKLFLRSLEFLKEYDIDILGNATVVSVDNERKTVKLSDGAEHSYDKLLVSTGGSALIPNIPGSRNSNVYSLRTFDDIQNIKNAAQNAKNIVIVGGSFIGMESASTLKKAFPNSNVTVVERSKTPFSVSLGSEVGSALQK